MFPSLFTLFCSNSFSSLLISSRRKFLGVGGRGERGRRGG